MDEDTGSICMKFAQQIIFQHTNKHVLKDNWNSYLFMFFAKKKHLRLLETLK